MLTKKKMLIPLGRGGPARPRTRADVVRDAIGATFIFILKVAFGWIGWIWDRLSYRKFTSEIRNHLSFLFLEHGAYFLPEKRSKSAIVAIVACGAVRLRFTRWRDEFHVSVSSEFVPERWETFGLITEGVTQWGSRRTEYTLETFEWILRKRLPFLEEALSKENAEATLDRAAETHNASVDAYAEQARKSGIEPIFYTQEPDELPSNP